ncbi:MAG: nucleotidyltransferase family protein [Prevotella sp.]|jgi:predicted nucleotidyltransferase|nr:nucleotidyltransferase family protein [Prevotella sp.]
MKKTSVIKRLQALKPRLREVGVLQLGLFGSTVRGENSKDSDIDVLLDFQQGKETYMNFIFACSLLEDCFKHTKVDVVTKNGLSPYIGKSILEEVEYV